MSIQQFCLRWNNHQPNFISVFTTLLNTESLVDVTLAAEGKHLQAHKVVLSACSVYFQTLFTANPSRHPIVILKDVKYADLRIMVDFMYYGEVNVSQEQLPQILETAKMLKIKGLTEMPDSTSLTKSQSTSSADVLMPGDSSWESQRHSISPCNLSPSVKRKRLRKTSTGSGSTSVERHVDEKPFEHGGGSSLNLVKSDCITLSSLPQPRRKDSFQEFKEVEENGGIDSNMHHRTEEPNNCLMRTVDQPLDDQTATNLSQQGGQWTMLEHGYPRYTSAACLGGMGAGGGGGALHTDAAGVVAFNVGGMMHPHMNVDMCDYQQQAAAAAAAGGGAGASPAGGAGAPGAPAAVAAAADAPVAPPKRRRTTNPQSEENFQRALEAVRFGGIGFCKAARMFGVNNRTLWLEYKKKGYPNNRPSIKNRIKQEHTSPPPEPKEAEAEAGAGGAAAAAAAAAAHVAAEQQVALLCAPPPLGMMGFIDSRPVDFGMQAVGRQRFDDSIALHNSPINLQGINFNSMQ